MNLSENIKSIREEKKISQSELAKRLGVEPTNYPRLEKRGNSLTYEYIELFAKALEVSVSELLHATDEPIENSDFEKLKRENTDLKFKIEDLEDDKRRLKIEIEEYEILIFDNSKELSWTNFNTVIYIVDIFKGLMHYFFEKQKYIESKDQEMLEYTNQEIKDGFFQMIKLSKNSPIINLIFNNYKLLKSAIIQEDGRIDVTLFRKEYNELVKNYRNEAESQITALPQ